MDEAEWWSCANPSNMLGFLIAWASERKMRFFVMACARDLVAYRPAAAAGDAGGRIETFKAAMDRVEAYADGHGPLTNSWIWIEEPEVFASAFAVVGVDPGVDLQLRDPLEAITDFRVNPAHWLRDIFGPLPFRSVPPVDPKALAGKGGTVLSLAQAAYQERLLPDGTLDADRLAVLADALEDAGCDNDDVLSHLRGPGPHVRGCWVVDLLLGRE